MTPSSAHGPTASCGCGTARSSRRRGAGRMALPEASAWAIVIGVVLVTAVIGFRPLLARLAARNIGRRKSRVLIVVAGLLVGTAIISSSLVVGDTLSYIFLEDVYARLDAIDELYANERAAADLNATTGQDLTLFYGATNQTIVHATVAGIVRDAGKAAYESRAILFMDLRRAQAAFNESGTINLIRISNRGGVADGVAYSERVTQDLRLSIATRHLLLRVDPVKADDTALAVQVGRDATDLFLVMVAFGILAGFLLFLNIFVMLAEERKPELGVARAVGFLRSDLLTTFALAGTFYALV